MAWIFSTAALTSPDELLSEDVLTGRSMFGPNELLLPAERFELPPGDAWAANLRLGREIELSPLSNAFKGAADVSGKKSF